MASTQVVEMLINTNNRPSQDYTTNPDDHSNHNSKGTVYYYIHVTQIYCGMTEFYRCEEVFEKANWIT